RPWLPVEQHATPRRRASSSRLARALVAPRNLKAPEGCRYSGLRRISPGASTALGISGVRVASPSILRAARSTSTKAGSVIVLVSLVDDRADCSEGARQRKTFRNRCSRGRLRAISAAASALHYRLFVPDRPDSGRLRHTRRTCHHA